MTTKSLGFRLYKCRTGWCFIRDDVGVVYEEVSRVSAFNSLSKALWHIAKRVKQIETQNANDVQQQPTGSAGTGTRRKAPGPEAQPPASGAGASEDASAS